MGRLRLPTVGVPISTAKRGRTVGSLELVSGSGIAGACMAGVANGVNRSRLDRVKRTIGWSIEPGSMVGGWDVMGWVTMEMETERAVVLQQGELHGLGICFEFGKR